MDPICKSVLTCLKRETRLPYTDRSGHVRHPPLHLFYYNAIDLSRCLQAGCTLLFFLSWGSLLQYCHFRVYQHDCSMDPLCHPVLVHLDRETRSPYMDRSGCVRNPQFIFDYNAIPPWHPSKYMQMIFELGMFDLH